VSQQRSVAFLFSAEGPLKALKPDYRVRPEQSAMAEKAGAESRRIKSWILAFF